MSASTRTVQQQALGTNPLGAALAVVALIIVVAAAIAFGSLGATKPSVTPANAGGLPAVGYDHTDHTPANAGGLPAVGYDHTDHSSTGANGVPTGGYDSANGYFGPSSKGFAGMPKSSVNSGNNGPRLRAQ